MKNKLKITDVKNDKEENKNKKQKLSESTKSAKELKERIIKEKKELQDLYMQKVKFTLKNTSSIHVKRDQIARLFTALRKIEGK